MSERPKLDTDLSSAAFREWYWLKEELTDFCRGNGLSAAGSKTELADRIALYLDTGKAETPRIAKKMIPMLLQHWEPLNNKRIRN